jgi:hypothetical protein
MSATDKYIYTNKAMHNVGYWYIYIYTIYTVYNETYHDAAYNKMLCIILPTEEEI